MSTESYLMRKNEKLKRNYNVSKIRKFEEKCDNKEFEVLPRS